MWFCMTDIIIASLPISYLFNLLILILGWYMCFASKFNWNTTTPSIVQFCLNVIIYGNLRVDNFASISYLFCQIHC